MTTTNRTRFDTVAAIAATVLLSLLLVISCTTVHLGKKTVKPPIKVAHRGGSQLAPENTLTAFQRGIDEGADVIELDVHLSKDGGLIVMHDPKIKRTTGQEGHIADYSTEELEAMDARSSFEGDHPYPFSPIPTLEDVLELLLQQDRKVDLQVEIKVDQDGKRYEGIEEKVIASLSEYGMIERTVLISFDVPTLKRIQELEPLLETGILISLAQLQSIGLGGPEAVAQAIADSGSEWVGINYRYLSQKLYDELRAHGMGIGVWTVNSEKEIKRFAAMGVDFITSDRPDLLAELLD